MDKRQRFKSDALKSDEEEDGRESEKWDDNHHPDAVVVNEMVE